jgi:hypothetical protein
MHDPLSPNPESGKKKKSKRKKKPATSAGGVAAEEKSPDSPQVNHKEAEDNDEDMQQLLSDMEDDFDFQDEGVQDGLHFLDQDFPAMRNKSFGKEDFKILHSEWIQNKKSFRLVLSHLPLGEKVASTKQWLSFIAALLDQLALDVNPQFIWTSNTGQLLLKRWMALTTVDYCVNILGLSLQHAWRTANQMELFQPSVLMSSASLRNIQSLSNMLLQQERAKPRRRTIAFAKSSKGSSSSAESQP